MQKSATLEKKQQTASATAGAATRTAATPAKYKQFTKPHYFLTQKNSADVLNKKNNKRACLG